MTPDTGHPARTTCHYVTISELASDPIGGELVVYCHPCDRHIGYGGEVVLEEDWDAEFIAMVMDHHGFTDEQRDSVWLAGALGDMSAALILVDEMQGLKCPDRPARCTHR